MCVGSVCWRRSETESSFVREDRKKENEKPDTRALRPRVFLQLPMRVAHRSLRSARWARAASTRPPTALPPPLSAADLSAAARTARLAGAAYLPDDTALRRHLDASGARLVASGAPYFTRWMVCDVPELLPGAPVTRVLAARGVTWAAAGTSTLRLWQALARAWPAALIEGSDGGASIGAHAGVGELARALARDVAPCLASSPHPILMTGHSLGGALALASALALMRDGELTAPPRVVTFGAPPILAPLTGGRDPLTVAGLPPHTVTAYVSAGDPVPRWLQTAEPVASAAAAALRAIGVGDAGVGATATTAPVTSRAWFQSVGDTYLLSWSPETGTSVVPLPRGGVDGALADAAPEGRNDADGGVRRALGFLLDHAHTR